MRDPSKKPRPVDFPLLVCVVVLVCFGIIMVFSSSYYYAQVKYDNAFYYASKQIGGALLGFFAMWLITRIDYGFLRKCSKAFLGISIVLLVAVLIIGADKNGGKRWIEIGPLSFQPAEIVKFAIILFLADSMAKNRDKIAKFKYGLLPYGLLLVLICGLIMLQPNLSMVLCIGATWYAMMFAGGLPIKQLGTIAVVGVAAVAFLAFGAGYRSSRMTSFVDPWEDAAGAGYQIIQSLYAVASGGLFGTGLGQSRQKMLFLPYRESDFIFAIIAEEFGFIGVTLFFALLLFMFWRGVKIAMSCDDMFGSLVAIGVVCSIAVQTILNICVAIKLVPATGLTLPFVSAGLTSLVVMMANAGLLLNISRHCSPRRRAE